MAGDGKPGGRCVRGAQDERGKRPRRGRMRLVRPLRELDPAVCRNLAGVVFDIDDTITDHGRLTDGAYRALWDLSRAGLTLVAVTGRPLGWCDVFARQWPVAAAVGENGGGWIFRSGSAVVEGYFDDEAERGRQQARLAAIEQAARAAVPGLRLAGDQRLRRVDLAFDVGEEVRLAEASVARLLEVIHAAGARSLVSSVHAHAFFGAHDKATGAASAVKAVLGRDLAAERERWLFVGDSGNDAAAFAWFPVSAGVANVRAHLGRLPVPPAFVADAERGAGFAEIAVTVLSARPGL
jgi:HAD superfamily hydrolase (TIGR01484 family)